MQGFHEREALEALGGAHPMGAVGDFAAEREELRRVLEHPEIRRSISLSRFLTFICEKYFEDKTNEIREHSIAVHALGRKQSSFDSQVDPIVRVTARALRKRLREFYEGEGKDHTLEIVIPIGRYIPQFVPMVERRTVEAAAVAGGVVGNTFQVAIDLKGNPRLVALKAEAASAPIGIGGWQRMPRWLYLALLVGFPLVFGLGMLLGRRVPDGKSAAANSVNWGDPVWSDEFNGAAQQAPDAAKWTFDVGGQGSWGNHEMETYCAPGVGTANAGMANTGVANTGMANMGVANTGVTNTGVTRGCEATKPNAFLDGKGHLVLRAEKNAEGNWTSARITTRGLKTFEYGRIEARMKLPVGTGLWPAFWLLGANFPTVGWPNAGTMDVVENVGVTSQGGRLGPDVIRSSLHGPGYAGGNSRRGDFKLPNGKRIDDGAFHTYGILWSPGMIQFYVDDPANVFFVQEKSSLPDGAEWVFDHPFYMVMDLAVGGDWAGDPDNTTPVPADVLVDYVRVYPIPTAKATVEWTPVDVPAGGSAESTIRVRGTKGTGRVTVACAVVPATATCELDAATVDFADSAVQDDRVTLAGAAAGQYSMTVTATTMGGERTESTKQFAVVGNR